VHPVGAEEIILIFNQERKPDIENFYKSQNMMEIYAKEKLAIIENLFDPGGEIYTFLKEKIH